MESPQNTWFRVNRDRSNNSPPPPLSLYSTSALMISLFRGSGVFLCRITSADGFKTVSDLRVNCYGTSLRDRREKKAPLRFR